MIVVGHGCHRAAGAGLGHKDLLGRGRQDIGGFRHEMHAAEDNALCLAGRSLSGEFQRVPGHVRMRQNGGTLVVVSQDQQACAPVLADGFDSVCGVCHAEHTTKKNR